MSALDLVSRIREALGDNGKRMQDELLDYCRELVASKAKLEEAERERARLQTALTESNIAWAGQVAQAAALAEALERLADAKGCADPDCCDAAREQEAARVQALAILTTYREGR